MGIQAAEISAILKDQIKNFGQEAEVAEVGQVLSVGDGIARIYGLDKVQAGEGEPLDTAALHSPLPRAYEWIDGSAYINHVVLVRKGDGDKSMQLMHERDGSSCCYLSWACVDRWLRERGS